MNPYEILESIATFGQPPSSGCREYSHGIDDAIQRLRSVYIDGTLRRGNSTEKFVIGPYGSGKTHFLRHLLEIATEAGCATAEIKLDKKVDPSKLLMIYQAVARSITVPGAHGEGMGELLRTLCSRIKEQSPDDKLTPEMLRAWSQSLEGARGSEPRFRSVVESAIEAIVQGDEVLFAKTVRWLTDGMSDTALSKELQVTRIVADDKGQFGEDALITLGQLIRKAGLPGTVVGIDEAEQSYNVGKAKLNLILSLLRTTTDHLANADEASLMVVYAFTPDVHATMRDYPALQQRISDPGQGMGFFGEHRNTRAPVIDLRDSSLGLDEDLAAIACNIVSLTRRASPEVTEGDLENLSDAARSVARDEAATDASASARRRVAKRVAFLCLHFLEQGQVIQPPTAEEPIDEPEV